MAGTRDAEIETLDACPDATLDACLDAVAAMLAGVLASAAPRGLGDDELLSAMGALERVGRLLDAHRAGYAGEVAERSRVELGSERLSARKGCRGPGELIERVTQVSGAEARRRVLVGAAARARTSLTGDPMPAAYPHLAAALATGAVGLDAAHMIVRELGRVGSLPHVDPFDVEIAEQYLIETATGSGDGAPVRATADEVRVHAQAWAYRLDQDGPEPDDERAMRRRGLRLGRARDGLIPVTGELMPEIAAGLTRLFDAHLAPRSGGGFMTEEQAALVAATGEQRSADQQRHDVLAAIITTAARSGEHPTIGGAAPTVLVSVRSADLTDVQGDPPSARRGVGRGVGHADGVEIPVSMRAVKQLMCTGGVQRVVFDGNGRIIELGSPERCFTPQQRRAITLRDGGCIIPGCTVPASWCEIHHVIPDADGGPTHPDNGVLVCWFHHRTIDTSGWGIRMIRGFPHVRPPAWLDPTGRWRPATKSPTRLADRLDDRLDERPPERATA
ncbi:DUF222 domain-containing protein [Agromyces sp. NPDC055520]